MTFDIAHRYMCLCFTLFYWPKCVIQLVIQVLWLFGDPSFVAGSTTTCIEFQSTGSTTLIILTIYKLTNYCKLLPLLLSSTGIIAGSHYYFHIRYHNMVIQ